MIPIIPKACAAPQPPPPILDSSRRSSNDSIYGIISVPKPPKGLEPSYPDISNELGQPQAELVIRLAGGGKYTNWEKHKPAKADAQAKEHREIFNSRRGQLFSEDDDPNKGWRKIGLVRKRQEDPKQWKGMSRDMDLWYYKAFPEPEPKERKWKSNPKKKPPPPKKDEPKEPKWMKAKPKPPSPNLPRRHGGQNPYKQRVDYLIKKKKCFDIKPVESTNNMWFTFKEGKPEEAYTYPGELDFSREKHPDGLVKTMKLIRQEAILWEGKIRLFEKCPENWDPADKSGHSCGRREKCSPGDFQGKFSEFVKMLRKWWKILEKNLENQTKNWFCKNRRRNENQLNFRMVTGAKQNWARFWRNLASIYWFLFIKRWFGVGNVDSRWPNIFRERISSKTCPQFFPTPVVVWKFNFRCIFQIFILCNYFCLFFLWNKNTFIFFLIWTVFFTHLVFCIFKMSFQKFYFLNFYDFL